MSRAVHGFPCCTAGILPGRPAAVFRTSGKAPALVRTALCPSDERPTAVRNARSGARRQCLRRANSARSTAVSRHQGVPGCRRPSGRCVPASDPNGADKTASCRRHRSGRAVDDWSAVPGRGQNAVGCQGQSPARPELFHPQRVVSQAVRQTPEAGLTRIGWGRYCRYRGVESCGLSLSSDCFGQAAR